MAAPGVSTVGVLMGYAVETTAGTKPAAFTRLHRINSTGDISIDANSIDASALEDYLDKYVAGRGSVGQSVDIQVNLTDETIAEWEALIEASQTAKAAGKATWFEEYLPELDKAFFYVADPPAEIPKPGLDQNGLVVATMSLTVNEYKGLDTAILPAEPTP